MGMFVVVFYWGIVFLGLNDPQKLFFFRNDSDASRLFFTITFLHDKYGFHPVVDDPIIAAEFIPWKWVNEKCYYAVVVARCCETIAGKWFDAFNITSCSGLGLLLGSRRVVVISTVEFSYGYSRIIPRDEEDQKS